MGRPVTRELGLRERNKLDKLRRIKAAVRTLIEEKGFDDTTTREIARRADVGLGTLFSYATDKRDLLFLIYNDDQERLTDIAFGRLAEDRSFLDQLVTAFRPFYEFFVEQPTFTRCLLRELIFYISGAQAARFQEGRRNIVTGLERIVARAKERGAIRSKEENRTIARVVFAVYQAEVRRWLLEDKPKSQAGLQALRRALRLVIGGLDPGEGAL